MLLTTLGFIIAGAIVGGAVLAAFWDDIKNWLNQVAADAVEKHFGYSARNKMQKAVAIIDRIANKLRNTSTVYTKKSPASTYFDKTTIICETGIENIEQDVIHELSNHDNRLVQEFQYAQ